MRKTGTVVMLLVATSVTVGSMGIGADRLWKEPQAASPQGPELRLSRRLVKQVQRVLTDQGYYEGAIDGLIGPQTREAVQNFQRAHRLRATGHLDEVTVRRLGIDVEGESEESEPKGLFGKIGSGAKTVGKAVAEGSVTGAKATKKGVVTGAGATAKGATVGGRATAKGATTAGQATAKGATVGGRATAKGTTTAAKATGKGVTKAGRAVKDVVAGRRTDEEILYDVQEKLRRDPQVDAHHIDIGVTDGTVTLTLREGKREELDRAAALARQIKGVDKVITRPR